MGEDDFFIYLPSNSSGKYYYDNKLSHWRTHLPTSINVNQQSYKVGLAEIIYNSSLPDEIKPENHSGLNSIHLQYDKEMEDIYFSLSYWPTVSAMFNTIFRSINNNNVGQKLLEQISFQIGSIAHNFKTDPPLIHSNLMKNSLRLSEGKAIIHFPVQHYASMYDFLGNIYRHILTPEMRDIFVEQCHNYVDSNSNYFSDKIADATSDHFLSFVYSDIISPSATGDKLANTLRVLQLKRTGGHIEFNPIYYKSLGKSNFQDITIELRRDDGSLVNFRASSKPTVVVLHFKKHI